MSKQSDSFMLRAAVALALVAAASGSAVAQQVAAATSGGLEDVIVSATRRDSNLQSTPIAVSAVDEVLIRQVSPENIGDLAIYVPNFSAAKVNGFNAASFAMRGVGQTDIIVYNESPVGVIVDDFVMPNVQTQLLDAFDVQQIEVLRGPQGTLFGKNTTGGAVVVHTKQAELNTWSAEANAQVGSPDLNLRNIQAAINVPLLTDRLALRVVASQETVVGYMRNSATSSYLTPYAATTGTFHGDGSRVGGTDALAARAKLTWQIADNLTAHLQYEQVHDRSDTPAAVNTSPEGTVFSLLGLTGSCQGDPLNCGGMHERTGFLIDMQRGHRVDSDGMYLNVDWKLAPGTLTVDGGYRSQDSSLPSDYTGTVGPLSVFDANRSDARKTYQAEVRFASKDIGIFNYVVGAFYQHDNTKFCVAQVLGIYDQFFNQLTNTLGLTPGGWNNNPQVACNAQEAKSTAAYAEFNIKPTERLTLTLGGRYTKDDKSFVARTQMFVQQLGTDGTIDPTFTWDKLPGGLMGATDFTKYSYGVVRDSRNWSSPTYRFMASYQFNTDLFGYFGFSHGYKAGGYNDQVGSGGTPITAGELAPTNPEKADSFELGVKAEFMDRRIRINEALFHVKYKDAIRQVVQPITNSAGEVAEATVFRNAAGMTVYGIEHELTAKLSEHLTLRLPASYQHCKYDEFTSDGAAFDLTSIPVARCPEYTATVALAWNHPAGEGNVTLEGSANYQSKNLDTFSIANAAPWAQTFLDARTLIDASVTYHAANDAWYFKALGRNLSDKRYVASSQNVDPLWIWTLYGAPRYFGLEYGVKFCKR
ncbi:MAG: TonB-dependent receptor [Proteobacteria bacterium]|nr:TonB-dependent receptor [Pseudomonadota bacterium]